MKAAAGTKVLWLCALFIPHIISQTTSPTVTTYMPTAPTPKELTYVQGSRAPFQANHTCYNCIANGYTYCMKNSIEHPEIPINGTMPREVCCQDFHYCP